MKKKTQQSSYQTLMNYILEEPIQIINIGLEKFAKTYQQLGINFVHVDWKPPVEVEDDLSDILDKIA